MITRKEYKESLKDLLLATLASGRSVRQFWSIINERKLNRYKKQSVRVALSRLHSSGYLNNSTSGWSVTQKGKAHVKNGNYILNYTHFT